MKDLAGHGSNPTAALPPALQTFVRPGPAAPLLSFVRQSQPTTPVMPHAGRMSVGSHKSRRRIVGHRKR
jgi:hypothetical protein